MNRKLVEEWWMAKKEGWANEQWGRLSGDDRDMREAGQRLRQEQWDAVSSGKWRNEVVTMAECFG